MRGLDHVPAGLHARRLRGSWTVAIAGVLISLLTANPLLTAASVLALVAIVALLWQPGEPPALLFAAGYQWLQASVQVFAADFEGVALRNLDLSGMTLQERVTNVDVTAATWLSVIGVVAIAAGFRLGAGRSPVATRIAAHASGTSISVTRALAACLASMALASAAAELGFYVGGLRQLVLAVANLHWVFLFVFAYAVLAQGKGTAALVLVLLLEVAIGFLGFFSEFKTALVIVLLAALAVPARWRKARLWLGGTVAILAVVLGIVWSAIKLEYRDFVNEGTGDQVVLVSRSDQIDELLRLVSGLDAEKFQAGAERLIDRLSYVYFFSEVMDMVPAYIPYENGELWGDAIYRTLVPRLLDPDKAPINDSERTSEYTGMRIIGGDVGTSVSLGYMAESYIDFGPVFMMAPIFIWGLAVGLAFRSFTRGRHAVLFGYGCATTLVALGASVLDASNAKMVAGFTVLWLVLYATSAYLSVPIVRRLAAPHAPGSRDLVAGRARQ